MTLRRQIFTSFVIVAALPLIVVTFFLFERSAKLAFSLYTQNLHNATELQSQMFDNSINNFMVRAARFASSEALQKLTIDPTENQNPKSILENPEIATEIMQFTDETLDSVIAFSILNEDAEILYSSGSNSDIARLKSVLPDLSFSNTQQLMELLWTGDDSSLILTTPIAKKSSDTPNGMLVVAYDSDYFLKGISTYQQTETTNSIIYCTNHEAAVREKKEISGGLDDFQKNLSASPHDSITFELEGQMNLGYYKRIQKTPWVLINYIPKKHIYASLAPYALLGGFVVAVVLMIIIFFSRIQSKRILGPLARLLNYVEALFVSNANPAPSCEISGKTEIGYLAEKFKGMSTSIAQTQGQLNESNYLYQSILHATYAMRVIVNYTENTVICSSPEMMQWLDDFSELDAPDAVMCFFEYTSTRRSDVTFESLRNVLHGNIRRPSELEVCCRQEQTQREIWFRIIAVPIIADDILTKLVLHFEDISTKKQEELRLLESSKRDPLCRLLNKQAFAELAQNYMAGKSNHAVFFIDLDCFKQVNDRLGHAVGDTVLIHCAQTIAAQFSRTDLVARYGGDEFVVLASGLPIEMFRVKADALVKKLVVEKVAREGDIIRVTASVGVYITPQAESLEMMTHYADDAMYQAKKDGKARYCIVQKNEGVML